MTAKEKLLNLVDLCIENKSFYEPYQNTRINTSYDYHEIIIHERTVEQIQKKGGFNYDYSIKDLHKKFQELNLDQYKKTINAYDFINIEFGDIPTIYIKMTFSSKKDILEEFLIKETPCWYYLYFNFKIPYGLYENIYDAKITITSGSLVFDLSLEEYLKISDKVRENTDKFALERDEKKIDERLKRYKK